jgi:hypothetical protein
MQFPMATVKKNALYGISSALIGLLLEKFAKLFLYVIDFLRICPLLHISQNNTFNAAK